MGKPVVLLGMSESTKTFRGAFGFSVLLKKAMEYCGFHVKQRAEK
jgi:hypothetical protein